MPAVLPPEATGAAADIQPQAAKPVVVSSGAPGSSGVAEAIIDMYLGARSADEVIDAYYAVESSFEDPLVHVLGREDVKGQFRALQQLFRSPGSSPNVRSIAYAADHVLVEWSPRFVLRGLPDAVAVRLPTVTSLALDTAGRVTKHTDHWSLHEALGGLPLVGLVYRGWKRLAGKASSVLTNLAWDATTTTAKDKGKGTAGGGGAGGVGGVEVAEDAALPPRSKSD